MIGFNFYFDSYKVPTIYIYAPTYPYYQNNKQGIAIIGFYPYGTEPYNSIPSTKYLLYKIEKIDKIFSVRTSAWRSVRKQKRKRAEVTVLYGIVEKYVKNLCIRRRWVTREYERRKMRALFFTA